MYVFSPRLPTSRLARFSCLLPLSLARGLGAVAWGLSYIFNVNDLRATISSTVAKATGSGKLKKHTIGMGGAVAFGRYINDFAFFLHRPVEAILRRTTKHTSFCNMDELIHAHRRGKGTILVSSNFCCFYYALTTVAIQEIRDMDLVIVQPSYSVDGAAAQEFKKKISAVMGRELKVIESGTLRAGIEMTAALKRGAVVACLIDFFPPNNASFAITEFLNHPSCQPTGISAIAALTGAPVVPFFTFYEDGQFVTTFYDAILPPARHTDNDSVLKMCHAIDQSLSRVILARPSEWAAWISVPVKWQAATALISQMEEASDAAV